jgi:hypothetical protein
VQYASIMGGHRGLPVYFSFTVFLTTVMGGDIPQFLK